MSQPGCIKAFAIIIDSHRTDTELIFPIIVNIGHTYTMIALSRVRIIAIFGIKHPVRARIERIESFSGHGDYGEMKQYLLCQDPKSVKKVFLVHGEYKAQQFYSKELEKAGFRNISIPEPRAEFTL